MGLKERLEADQRDALRSGHGLRLTTIRMLRSAIHGAEIARRATESKNEDGSVTFTQVDAPPLTDEEIEVIVGQQVRQRRDAMAAYKQAGRQERYDQEAAELEVLLAYQTQGFAGVEIEALARAVIDEVGAAGPRDAGKVMGRLAPQLRDKKVDMGGVREVVERLLAERAESAG